MYLVDQQIHEIFKHLNFICPNPEHKFENDQIQPCSIDLRLSDVYWKRSRTVTRSRVLDITRTGEFEHLPRVRWRKRKLHDSDLLTIKPGELVLARTYEKFTIPNGYAGKIEGKSSYARLGLGIHCAADFINPGYRGHMTLQLFNYSRDTLKLPPYISICQLIIVQLRKKSDHPYADTIHSAKYMDDDGGPSYWWRDRLFRKLLDRYGDIDDTKTTAVKIISSLGEYDLSTVSRYVAHIERKAQHENVDDSLDSFSKIEARRSRLYKFFRWFVPALSILPAGRLVFLYTSASADYSIAKWLFLALFALIVPSYFLISSRKTYYVPKNTLVDTQ